MANLNKGLFLSKSQFFFVWNFIQITVCFIIKNESTNQCQYKQNLLIVSTIGLYSVAKMCLDPSSASRYLYKWTTCTSLEALSVMTDWSLLVWAGTWRHAAAAPLLMESQTRNQQTNKMCMGVYERVLVRNIIISSCSRGTVRVLLVT